MANERKRCEAMVYRTHLGWLDSNVCNRTGQLEHEGRWWCKVHHPPTIAARKANKEAERRAEEERKALLRAAADRHRQARELREMSDADLHAECKRRGWVVS